MANEAKQDSTGRDIQRKAPVHGLTPFEDADRLLDSFFRRSWMRPWHFDWHTIQELKLPFNGHPPKVDVIDREAEIIVRAGIPGVEKKDLDISVGEDSVTIKGVTHREKKEEKGDYYRQELAEGAFSRTVELPAMVDGTRATASFKDGVLELTLPKLEKTKRHSVKVE